MVIMFIHHSKEFLFIKTYYLLPSILSNINTLSMLLKSLHIQTTVTLFLLLFKLKRTASRKHELYTCKRIQILYLISFNAYILFDKNIYFII